MLWKHKTLNSQDVNPTVKTSVAIIILNILQQIDQPNVGTNPEVGAPIYLKVVPVYCLRLLI